MTRSRRPGCTATRRAWSRTGGWSSARPDGEVSRETQPGHGLAHVEPAPWPRTGLVGEVEPGERALVRAGPTGDVVMFRTGLAPARPRVREPALAGWTAHPGPGQGPRHREWRVS